MAGWSKWHNNLNKTGGYLYLFSNSPSRPKQHIKLKQNKGGGNKGKQIQFNILPKWQMDQNGIST